MFFSRFPTSSYNLFIFCFKVLRMNRSKSNHVKYLHFKRLYRTAKCRDGPFCKFRDKSCLFYHCESEKRKPQKLKIQITWNPIWETIKMASEERHQRLLNVFKIACNYQDLRKKFLFKTKLCKHSHCKRIKSCPFAHCLAELRPQNILLQKPYRICLSLIHI